MGILDKAKQASESDDKKDEKPKAKKKHHPSAEKGAPPSVPDAGDADEGPEGAGEDAGDEQEPDAGADDSEPQGGGDDSGGAADAPPAPEDGGGDQDQGASQPQAPQGEGDQQAPQGGAPPVVNPQAPGAGDDSENSPSPDQGPETPGEDTEGGMGAAADIQQVPMSPGLQDEYKRLNDKVMQLLYGTTGDKLASAALKGIMPDGPGKIKGPALLAVHIVGQLHAQDKFPLILLLPVVKDVVGHLMDLAEQVKQIKYTDQESVAILGLAYEVALRSSGMTKQQAHQVHGLLGKQGVMKHMSAYQKAHAFAKPAMMAAHGGPQPTQPTPAGPQTGAPAGSMTPPNAAAPAPAPEQSAQSAEDQGGGGMLSQAAGQQGAA